jgi:hypothetical protein
MTMRNAVCLAGALIMLLSVPALCDPDIKAYAVPSTLVKLQATARTVSADQSELRKIGRDFGEAYRLHEATYTFTAPDRMEYRAHAGFLSVIYTTTNTQRVIRIPPLGIHQTIDISKDITKRQTLFNLGVLPTNYLETMRSEYVGKEVVHDTSCEIFVLRYITDLPKDNRRFMIWVDPVKHVVVQKRVWDGGNHEHETIAYLKPVEVIPGFWLPTVGEAFAPDGKLAGTVEYVNIKAN